MQTCEIVCNRSELDVSPPTPLSKPDPRSDIGQTPLEPYRLEILLEDTEIARALSLASSFDR